MKKEKNKKNVTTEWEEPAATEAMGIPKSPSTKLGPP
jgi:hypothetical protein